MRPFETVEDTGSRSLVGRLIEVSVNFGGTRSARSTRYWVEIEYRTLQIQSVRRKSNKHAHKGKGKCPLSISPTSTAVPRAGSRIERQPYLTLEIAYEEWLAQRRAAPAGKPLCPHRGCQHRHRLPDHAALHRPGAHRRHGHLRRRRLHGQCCHPGSPHQGGRHGQRRQYRLDVPQRLGQRRQVDRRPALCRRRLECPHRGRQGRCGRNHAARPDEGRGRAEHRATCSMPPG